MPDPSPILEDSRESTTDAWDATMDCSDALREYRKCGDGEVRHKARCLSLALKHLSEAIAIDNRLTEPSGFERDSETEGN